MQREQESLHQLYRELGLSEGQLRWSRQAHNVIVSGQSDFTNLTKLRNIILALRRDWSPLAQGGVQIHSDLHKRLQLAESQIDGLLRRQITYTAKDSNGGERVLDYSQLLNEKENQVVELCKKIENIQERLRRASARQIELENHVAALTQQLRTKDDLITLKHQAALAQLAISNSYREAFVRLRRNLDLNKFKLGENQKIIMDGVNIPDVSSSFDLKADVFNGSRSKIYQQQSQGQKYRLRLVELFRELQRLGPQSSQGQPQGDQGPKDADIELVLEGFLAQFKDSRLYKSVQYSIDTYHTIQDYIRIKENFGIAAGIYREFISALKARNINLQFPIEAERIFQILKGEQARGIMVQSGAVFITEGKERVVEIPVSDIQTKRLIHMFAVELKRLFFKYPKLQEEINPKIADFVREQVIEAMSVDQIDRLVQIVKYVPQIVKVDHVYTQSTEKERKVQFHLRVLIKALLEELQKIRLKTGVVLQMDEGVIGMIRGEIMDVVNVEDILKVFRVVPKIVQVEKLVQKVVDRVVQIPKIITVQKIVEKVIEVEKIKEVQKIVNVPIETPMVVETYIEKLVHCDNRIETIVQVPTIVEKLVELRKQVPRIEEIEVFRDKIVQVEKPVEVERVINHIQVQYQQVQVLKQKIIPAETVVEKIVQVPVFVEKIVERVVEIPKVVQVQKIIQKIVPAIEYRNAREVQNHIEVKYQIVQKIVQKIVPVVQIKQRIKEVVQQVQKIVQVRTIVPEIHQVEVIRQKLVQREVIKQVPTVVTQIVQTVKEVVVEVQRIIQVPVIRQIPVIKEIVVQKPIVSRVQSVHIKEVIVKEPFIVRKPEIVQVQKIVNVYVEVPKPIKYIEQKIVEVPVTIDRIKQVPVQVQKVIEKMVQVPKVVEVQKIVEKVVVVPRIIEKVIEVPQFIQKIVEKEVIRETVRDVQVQIQVPVIKQVIKEVEVQKQVYIEVQKVVDRVIRENIEVPILEQLVQPREILRQIPINIIQEVPRQITVEKIVPQLVEVPTTIEIEKQIIVPIEIPVPVNLVTQKVVPLPEIIERVISVPQVLQKIVPVIEEVVRIQQIEKIVERIVVQKSIQQIQKIVPYINQVLKQVPTIIEKIVPVETKVEQIVTAQQIIEKVVEKTISIPRIIEVEKLKEKIVEIPRIVEIQKIVPKMIKVNQIVHKIVQKLVEVPTVIETLKEVVRENQKVVAQSVVTTQVKEVQRLVEKVVYAQKLKQVVRNVNYIQKVLEIIDRIEHVPVQVRVTEEKFIEVPFILEKIVQKIILMPQIVEVLKYVHQVTEVQDAGAAVNVDIGVHQARYKELSRTIQTQLDLLLKDLRALKSDQKFKPKIQGIEAFLQELRKFILVPRIVKVTEEKIVEKQVLVDKIVRMPVEDQQTLRMELSLGILVEKLVAEIRRLKQKTGVQLQLDEDIKLIFLSDLGAKAEGQAQSRLKNYSALIQRQFESMGGWSHDHQIMLNSFLQQRFVMTELLQNANNEIQRARHSLNGQSEGLRASRSNIISYAQLLDQIAVIVNENRPLTELSAVLQTYSRIKTSVGPYQHTQRLDQLSFGEQRIASLIRQKDQEIRALRASLLEVQKFVKGEASSSVVQSQGLIAALRAQYDDLKRENNALLTRTAQLGLTQSLRQQIQQLKARNFDLQTQISQLRSDLYNKQQQIKLVQQGLSFRRDPESKFRQIDIDQPQGASGSRAAYQAQQGQGQSLGQSGTRAGQGAISGVGQAKLTQSFYTAERPQTGYDPLYQSQRRTVQQSPIPEQLYQSRGQTLTQGSGYPQVTGQSGYSQGLGQSGYSQGTGQSGVRYVGTGSGFGTQGGIQQQGSTGVQQFGTSSGLSGQQNLYASRQQGSRSGLQGATATQSFIQDPRVQQSGRGYIQGTQQTTLSAAQGHVSGTPVQQLKYQSPQPAAKMSGSYVKQEGSTLTKPQNRRQESVRGTYQFQYPRGNDKQ